MSRRVLGLALVLMTFLAMSGGDVAQAHNKKWKSEVFADYNYPDLVFGVVMSDRGACMNDRRVKLIHVDGETGDTTLAGRTRTLNNGYYSIEPSIVPVLGDEWIVRAARTALKKNKQHRHLCLAGRIKIAA